MIKLTSPAVLLLLLVGLFLLASCHGSITTTVSSVLAFPTSTTVISPVLSTASSATSYPATETISTAVSSAAKVIGTLPIPAAETPLFVPFQGSLIVLLGSSGSPDSFTVMRVDQAGDIAQATVTFPLASYLMSVSAGSDGIYAGTSVIKRFTCQADELLRIDAETLEISAQASFPASVTPLAAGADLWVSVGDGRILKLDPETLAVLSSEQILGPSETSSSSALLSKPALGLGSLWVLAGDESDLELIRLDPATLAIRSRTQVPTAGFLHQALYRVVADSGHVYLTGSAVVAVDEKGKLVGSPSLVPGLENADIIGLGLVGPAVQKGQAALLRLDPEGDIVARAELRDVGAQIEVSGNNVWIEGDAGQGNGIVHLRITGS